MIDFKDATTKELVDAYNALADALGHSPVAKFADRATAEKRTRLALSSVAPDKRPGRFKEDPAPAKGTTKSHPAIKGVAFTPAEKQPADIVTGAALKTAAADAIAKGDNTPSPPVSQPSGKGLPVASDNPAKDAEMPALRRALKLVELAPKSKVYPRKAGTKQALLVDLLSRHQGATFGELYDAMEGTGSPWRGVTIRSGLAWDMNHLAGYGITSSALNGEEFHALGRDYEAHRLGFGTPAYDPSFKLLVYRLTYPKDLTGPVPHTARAPAKPTAAQKEAAKAAMTDALKNNGKV